MHIALITTELNRGEDLYPGGLASYVYNVAVGLRQKGHQATIVLSGTKDQEYYFRDIHVVECAPSFKIFPVVLDRLFRNKIPETYNRLIRSWSIRKSLIRLCKNNKIDVIHYTNWKATGIFKINLPSTIRISSYDMLFDNNPASQHLDKRLACLTEKICIKRFSNVFGPGDYLARIIESELKLKKPIEIIPTPSNPVAPNLEISFKKEGKKLVVYAGTLSRFKGYLLLQEIMHEYLSKYDDTIFILCGKAGTVDGKSIKDNIQVLKEKYHDKLEWFEHLSKPDLMRAFQQADTVLITSLIDNFPNTALEAMSQNAIVIASETASLGMLIKDGINGYTMATRSASDWVNRIRHVICTMDDQQVLEIKKSIQISIPIFSMDNSISKLINYYKKVIAES